MIIFSQNMSDHCMRLTSVLNRFRQHNLRVKASKCAFGADKVIYLGHTVSHKGIHTDPAKIEVIQNLPLPSNLEKLRSFLGLAGYYRKYIPDFATVSAPLTASTKKMSNSCGPTDTKMLFRPYNNVSAQPQSLHTLILISHLCCRLTPQILVLGLFLHSMTGMGGGGGRVIAYASYTLSQRERNYSTMEKKPLQ